VTDTVGTAPGAADGDLVTHSKLTGMLTSVMAAKAVAARISAIAHAEFCGDDILYFFFSFFFFSFLFNLSKSFFFLPD
jgi:uncharacterized membrane-anchored protein